MHKKAICYFALILVSFCILLGGCSGEADDGMIKADISLEAASAKKDKTNRDSIPVVLTPEASGSVVHENDVVVVDASHTDQGYAMVRYKGTNGKVKLQLETPEGIKYTYLLSQEHIYETFPLTAGSGIYTLTVLENVSGDTYSIAFSKDLEVVIADEFSPFLHPNQYVSFSADSEAVKKGENLAKEAHSDLEVVENIYHYVVENITYDKEKAKNVSYGYLPDIDETLSSGTGICFDYAALMTGMLRTQRIPTKLEVGYAGEVYHAWISTYIEDTGWIDNIIEFDGTTWKLLDPTLGAGNSNREIKKFIGDGSNYVLKYSY